MAIDFTCTCGKTLRAPDEFAGKKAKCSGCGQAVSVPGGTSAGNGAARPAAAPKAAASPPRKPAAAPPAKAAAAPAKPKPAPAKRLPGGERRKPAPKPDEEDPDGYGVAAPAPMASAALGDFFDTELSSGPAALPTGNYCPSCRQAVPPNAVVCINCGYDSRSGKKHKTVSITDQPAALAPASSHYSSDHGASRSSDKSGLNSGVLGGIGLMVIAVAWFVGGLAVGYIFFYPPILFLIGVGAVIKGLFSRGD